MPTPPIEQIPAEHLPLVFHAAAGWPTPTLEWVTTHLGWQPPPGWVPVAGCPHSPPRWQFWSRNDRAWARMARPHLRASRRNLWAGCVLVALAIGTLVSGVLSGADPIRLVLGAVLLVTVTIKISRTRTELRRIEADLFAGLRSQAEQLKSESDRAHYERYLRSSSAY